MTHRTRFAIAVALALFCGGATGGARAAESGPADLARYAVSLEDSQVTSISQFSDVQPTDWSYQALSSLIERYGCVAGYPNGTYRGGQAMTRYEAAALLNACLDRITEVTDELRRLMKEFEKELAVLRGRVDGLEARATALETLQFSTTTRLRADTRWVLGGLDYSGNTVDASRYRDPSASGYVSLPEALTFNYDVRLNFDTSFTGKDLLRTQLRAGNFAQSGFGAPPTPITQLDAGFEENCGTGTDCGDVVAINRLYYSFPLSSTLWAVAGPRVRQDDLLPVWPSVYTGDKILKFFQYAGAPGAYSQVLGAGGGLWWRSSGRPDRPGGWSLGLAYVAANGDNASPAAGGLGTDGSVATGTVQLAYTGRNWNLTAAYTRSGAGVSFPGTPLSVEILPTRGIDNGYTDSFALSCYWQPFASGWLPSISAGWGTNRIYYTGGDTQVPSDERGFRAASQSWSVGLVWSDVLVKGNSLGFAFGQPTRTTNSDGDTVCTVWFPPACREVGVHPEGNFHDPDDGGFAYELYYRIQVTDNLALTPSLFWFSRPLGQYTLNSGPGTDESGTLRTLGYLVQATFRF
ncbi:MAG: iron uptake porin [Cyanobium sp.]